MKNIHKIISAILIFTIISASGSFAQIDSEYDFFVFKAGVSHNFFDPQPGATSSKFLKSQYNEDFHLIPSSSYIGYTTGYQAGFIFNHDLRNNYTGIAIGVEYQSYGISAKYETEQKLYTLVEDMVVTNISIPAYFKISKIRKKGANMFPNQKYFYFGVEYNLNLSLSKIDEVGWSSTKSKTVLDKNQVVKSNYGLIFGFNYTIFNFQADYILGGFLNKTYEEKIEGESVKPYAKYQNNVFLIKTSIAIPLNPWTSKRYYTVEKKIRRLLK